MTTKFRVSPVMTASHTPPEDRQARLSGAGRGYIRHRRNTSADATIYIFKSRNFDRKLRTGLQKIFTPNFEKVRICKGLDAQE